MYATDTNLYGLLGHWSILYSKVDMIMEFYRYMYIPVLVSNWFLA